MNTWWLIEMQGPCYLSARHCGGYEFYWTEDSGKGIRFADHAQANMVMMAVRQLRGELFQSCLPHGPRAVEHVWIAGEGIRRK